MGKLKWKSREKGKNMGEKVGRAKKGDDGAKIVLFEPEAAKLRVVSERMGPNRVSSVLV